MRLTIGRIKGMYYRYKVKKKDRKSVKILIVLSLCLALGYAGYQNRQYLLFWKYTFNKLQTKINEAEKIKNQQQRQLTLQNLCQVFDLYKEENPIDEEAYALSARAHFLLGMAYLPGDLSELLINDAVDTINSEARKEFFNVIRDLRKVQALLDDENSGKKHILMLSQSCYLSGFLSREEIFEIIRKINPEEFTFEKVDDARFFALMHILNKNDEFGFSFLTKKGMTDEGVGGLLFLATAERIAERYTNAIMNYRTVIDKTNDDRILKLVHMNLGKIYYNQSLYTESLAHFDAVLKIDERDTFSRIWIGKNYSAMGFRDRAKAIWTEILAADRSNSEVKKLLGVM